MSDLWRANGKELFFSNDPHDFVGLHTEALPEVIAERHNATAHQAAQWRHANTIAATAFVQQEARAGELEARAAALESHLGQAHELLRTLEAARKADNAHAFDELTRMQVRLDQAIERNGYLGRLLEILRDAAWPASTALFNIGQMPTLDEHIRETIGQTLAPLDAALAATKASK